MNILKLFCIALLAFLSMGLITFAVIVLMVAADRRESAANEPQLNPETPEEK